MDFILLHWHCILPVLLILYLMIPKKSENINNTTDDQFIK